MNPKTLYICLYSNFTPRLPIEIRWYDDEFIFITLKRCFHILLETSRFSRAALWKRRAKPIDQSYHLNIFFLNLRDRNEKKFHFNCQNSARNRETFNDAACDQKIIIKFHQEKRTQKKKIHFRWTTIKSSRSSSSCTLWKKKLRHKAPPLIISTIGWFFSCFTSSFPPFLVALVFSFIITFISLRRDDMRSRAPLLSPLHLKKSLAIVCSPSLCWF